jgi:hypothetical protein
MDSASLFLTANSDTVYFWGFVDLSDGPMVIDVPPLGAPTGILGTIDDMWLRWVTDLGLPGPDRAAGGRYLIVRPDYDGPLPDGGFHVSHSRTTRVTALGRAFMVDNDPRTPTEVIREGIRVSRYEPGTQGTAVGTFLSGRAPLGAPSEVAETRFVDVSGKSFNTIYPNDFSFWELVHELVQQEPPGAGDPELMGLLASVGIVHGKPFEPDDRMRKILEEAVEVGNATARTVTFAARPEEGFAYYPGVSMRGRPHHATATSTAESAASDTACAPAYGSEIVASADTTAEFMPAIAAPIRVALRPRVCQRIGTCDGERHPQGSL